MAAPVSIRNGPAPGAMLMTPATFNGRVGLYAYPSAIALGTRSACSSEADGTSSWLTRDRWRRPAACSGEAVGASSLLDCDRRRLFGAGSGTFGGCVLAMWWRVLVWLSCLGGHRNHTNLYSKTSKSSHADSVRK